MKLLNVLQLHFKNGSEDIGFFLFDTHIFNKGDFMECYALSRYISSVIYGFVNDV